MLVEVCVNQNFGVLFVVSLKYNSFFLFYHMHVYALFDHVRACVCIDAGVGEAHAEQNNVQRFD